MTDIDKRLRSLGLDPDQGKPEFQQTLIKEMIQADRGQAAVHLVITFDALHEILTSETSVIDPDDVPGLLRVFALRAVQSGHSDVRDLGEWLDKCDEVTTTDEDED